VTYVPLDAERGEDITFRAVRLVVGEVVQLVEHFPRGLVLSGDALKMSLAGRVADALDVVADIDRLRHGSLLVSLKLYYLCDVPSPREK
jgi:hypothetical protein